jgi:dihydroorotate dehydrogenase (NAD+) catalytic subunit
VTEFAGGMLNSIGLANPGLAGTRRDKLPWIRSNVRRAQVFVSVAGHRIEEYHTLVEGLDGEDGFLGFEINLSCPNDTKRGGAPFALDPDAVAAVLEGCRSRTQRPLLAKLAPNDPALENTARVATDAGADGLTLVNTLPGILLGTGGDPVLGAGPGGMSGPALRPAGLLAVRKVRLVTHLPLVGVGGVGSGHDAVAYARAGAALVEVGTASFAEPRAGLRIARELEGWGRRSGVARWDDLVAPAPSNERET